MLNRVNSSVPDLVKAGLKLKGSTCRLLAPYGVSTNLNVQTNYNVSAATAASDSLSRAGGPIYKCAVLWSLKARANFF
jgi:hypothetical protein